MIDQLTTFLLSFAGSMAIIVFQLWIFKLPPFSNDTLGGNNDGD